MMKIQGNAVVVLLLCACVAAGHDLKHEASSSAAFLINQKDTTGTGLDDVDMAHLTDSIQGLFSINASSQPVARSSISKKVNSAVKLANMAAKPATTIGGSANKLPAEKLVTIAAKLTATTGGSADKHPAVALAVAKPATATRGSANKFPAEKLAKIAAKPKTRPATMTGGSANKFPAGNLANAAAKQTTKPAMTIGGSADKLATVKLANVAAKLMSKPATTIRGSANKLPVLQSAKNVAKPTTKTGGAVNKHAAMALTNVVAKPETTTGASANKLPAVKLAESAAKATKKTGGSANKHPAVALAKAAAKPAITAGGSANKHPPTAATGGSARKVPAVKLANIVAKPATRTGGSANKLPAVKSAKVAAKPKSTTGGSADKHPAKALAKVVAKPAAAAGGPASKLPAMKLAHIAAKPMKTTVGSGNKLPFVKLANGAAKPTTVTGGSANKIPTVKLAHVAAKLAKTTGGSANKFPLTKVVTVVHKPSQASEAVTTNPRALTVAKTVVNPIQMTKAAKKRLSLKEARVVAKPTMTIGGSANKIPAVKLANVAAKPTTTDGSANKLPTMNVANVAARPAAKTSNVTRGVSNRAQLKVPSQSNGVIIVTKLQVAQQAIAKSNINNTLVHVAKSNINNTLVRGSFNASANATLAEAQKNQTKKIEEVVSSLPMASFALDVAPPPKNTTKEHAFPGNATQKAAFMKREKFLEDQIATLKARLSNVSTVIEKRHPPQKLPAATGTFNSHLDGNQKAQDVQEAKATLVLKLPVPKVPAPMEPIRKEKKPKALWPTMGSVAAPVPVVLNATAVNATAAAVPPQKEAIEAQEGKAKNVVMGGTFTGTPVKKVQSVMALDSSLSTTSLDTSVSETDSTAPVASSSQSAPRPSWWNLATSFFSRAFQSPSEPLAQKKVASPRITSLLDATAERGLNEDMERTAAATREDGQHIVSLNSVWGQLEAEDRNEEDRVHDEDVAERVRASTPEKVRLLSKSELKGRHGTDVSSFWGTLEHEDADIEKSVKTDNLGEYQRLRELQDHQVVTASAQLQENELRTDRNPPLKHGDGAFLAKTIHDTWENLEKNDRAQEQRIHDSPDLQMLQLEHKWRPLH